MAISVALLASAFLPWERWCSGEMFGSGDPLGRCFSAKLWSGSAALAGLATVLLIGVLFVVSRGRLLSRPRPRETVLFAAILALLAVKLVVTSDNMATAERSNTLVSGHTVGFWIGLSIGLLALPVLAASIDFARPHRRRTLVQFGVVLAIVGLSIPYARSGLAWWGGPLAHPSFLGGGNGSAHLVEPGEPQLFQHLLFIPNLGDVAATFDGLDILDASGPIRVLDTYVTCFEHCPPDPIEVDPRLDPIGSLYDLDGYRLEPTGQHRSVLLAILYQVPEPGVYLSGWFRIRYHVGPLRYEVFRTDELAICAPEPGREGCPGKWF